MRRAVIVVLVGAIFGAHACTAPDPSLPSEPESARFAVTAFCDADVIGVGLVDVENDYLPHVITCENGGASYEALKVQAVAARSYLYYKLESSGSIMDGTGDQVYTCGASPGPNHYAAVADTSGQVLTYSGVVIAAFYVAGALQSPPACMGGTNDPTGTEGYVTYNWGLSGSALNQTNLGWVDPANVYNRGCMSQNGADCLSDDGWDYVDILHFYYGADIGLETAIGPCVNGMPPACNAAGTVVCGGTDTHTLTGAGTTDSVSSYSCNTYSYAGPEYAYELVATTSEPVTVSLTGLTADLDLFVLSGAGCDPASCIAESSSPDAMDESVTFDAVAGETYDIVVDGYQGAVSDFAIAFSCTGMPPPTSLPSLSITSEVATIEDQERDFAPDGDSAGIFDLYTTQPVTVRIYVGNDVAAADTARGVTTGVFAELPYVGIGRWDLYTNETDPAAGCGEEWCPDAVGDGPEQPPHDDPGSDLIITLGDIAPGVTKMIVLVAVGLTESIDVADHPDIRGWVLHADGVYDKPDFWSAPTLNEGQTFNGGDLRALQEMDVWEWTQPGRPPGGKPPPVTRGLDDEVVLIGVCACRSLGGAGVADSNAALPGATAGLLLIVALTAMMRGRRNRHGKSTQGERE